MTPSSVAASSSVRFLRQAPGVAERKNFFGPFCSGAIESKALAWTARSSHRSLLLRPSHSTSCSRLDAGVGQQVLVANHPPQLGRMGLERLLDRGHVANPGAGPAADEVVTLLGGLPPAHRQPGTGLVGGGLRVDHVAAVADQEDEPRAREHRHHQRSRVGAGDLLQDHQRRSHLVAFGRSLNQPVKADQHHAAHLGMPGVLVPGREEVVGALLQAERRAEGDGLQILVVVGRSGQGHQVVGDEGGVDRDRVNRALPGAGAVKPSMSSGSWLESTSLSGWASIRRSQVLPLRAMVQIHRSRDSNSWSSKCSPAVGRVPASRPSLSPKAHPRGTIIGSPPGLLPATDSPSATG